MRGLKFNRAAAHRAAEVGILPAAKPAPRLEFYSAVKSLPPRANFISSRPIVASRSNYSAADRHPLSIRASRSPKNRAFRITDAPKLAPFGLEGAVSDLKFTQQLVAKRRDQALKFYQIVRRDLKFKIKNPRLDLAQPVPRLNLVKRGPSLAA